MLEFLCKYPRHGEYMQIMSYLRGNIEMRVNQILGKRGVASVASAVLLCSFVCLNPSSAFATASEDAASGAIGPEPAKLAEPLQISEVPTGPYFAAESTDLLRRKLLLVSNYIQSYNRRLAADEVGNISQAIVQYSERYGVDYRLLTSLIAIESSFRRDAVSSSGAIGMGQLKPATAKWLGVMNPYDPVDNIAGTARFLSWLVKKYNGKLEYALSAYYQGPGFVDRNGIAPVCMPYLEKVNRALGPLM